jgi:hypothetical protein
MHIPNIHALNRILTHDPGFLASEDILCLRPLGYCDRLINQLKEEIAELEI